MNITKINLRNPHSRLSLFATKLLSVSVITTSMLISTPKAQAEEKFENLSVTVADDIPLVELLQWTKEKYKKLGGKEFTVICASRELENERLPHLQVSSISLTDFLKIICISLSNDERDVKVEKINDSIFCLKSTKKNPSSKKLPKVKDVVAVVDAFTKPMSELTHEQQAAQVKRALGDAKNISQTCKEVFPDHRVSVDLHIGTGLWTIKGSPVVVEHAKKVASLITARRKASVVEPLSN